MDARIERVVPGGRPSCHTWLIGDSDEVIVVDPGSDAQAVLTADGPAPHAGEHPDFPGQLSAIGQELLTLPEETRVLPGHGEEITVETAGRRFDAWVAAGPADGRAGTG